MRRTDRLFEIIQILRSQSSSITAVEIAENLEVSTRTIYRDIQALQSMRTPIEGEAGVGYMMRQGYDLPPINFTTVEIEAIVVGLNLVARTGDLELQRAANRVSVKIDSVRSRMDSLRVSDWGPSPPQTVDLDSLRSAIRGEQKLLLCYRDERELETRRTVLPLAMIYYVESIVLAGWCELRKDFRHFRVDRIISGKPKNSFFRNRSKALRAQWESQQKSD